MRVPYASLARKVWLRRHLAALMQTATLASLSVSDLWWILFILCSTLTREFLEPSRLEGFWRIQEVHDHRTYLFSQLLTFLCIFAHRSPCIAYMDGEFFFLRECLSHESDRKSAKASDSSTAPRVFCAKLIYTKNFIPKRESPRRKLVFDSFSTSSRHEWLGLIDRISFHHNFIW